ncbi:hypothetical protein Sango_2500700 [Sesamum angolense]|uniref:Uncharacterized protein n=1 Tax=Sesamum angolense TaxID=2727404 RepID=A0AAE2BI88_9LAMI|nr:hypothetical protein Sango_2500700 [Sesamum angolense]
MAFLLRLALEEPQNTPYKASGWHSRNHGTLHIKQASLRDETPTQGPRFSLGGRTKDLWKSGLPRPHEQRNNAPEEGVQRPYSSTNFFFFLGYAKGVSPRSYCSSTKTTDTLNG